MTPREHFLRLYSKSVPINECGARMLLMSQITDELAEQMMLRRIEKIAEQHGIELHQPHGVLQ